MTLYALRVYVPDVEDLVQTYDTLQVFRSTSGRWGSYVQITEQEATRASCLSSLAEPYNVYEETTFSIDLPSGSYDITVPSSSYTASALADIFNGVVTCAEDSDGSLLLFGAEGSSQWIRLSDESSWVDLGMESGLYWGASENLLVSSKTTQYYFTDTDLDTVLSSVEDVWYYFRPYSTDDDMEDPWGNPSEYLQPRIISASTVTCSFSLGGLDGYGAGMLVTFSPSADVDVSGSRLGFPGTESVTIQTDEDGDGEIELVPGAVVYVTIHGSGVSRSFTVPSENFDLFDALGTDDRFDVVVPSRTFAIRRSL